MQASWNQRKGGRLDPSEFLLQRGQINWLRAPRLCHNSFSRAITRIDPRYMRRPWCKRNLTTASTKCTTSKEKWERCCVSDAVVYIKKSINPELHFSKTVLKQGIQYISYQGYQGEVGRLLPGGRSCRFCRISQSSTCILIIWMIMVSKTLGILSRWSASHLDPADPTPPSYNPPSIPSSNHQNHPLVSWFFPAGI